MKLVHIVAGQDGESRAGVEPLSFDEADRTRTHQQTVESVRFRKREQGSFVDFHPAPRPQYVLYLTAQVEVGFGDGSTIVLDPGDVLLEEDTTGHGHTSKVLADGISVVIPLAS